jgi:hypothetical protein
MALMPNGTALPIFFIKPQNLIIYIKTKEK